MSYEDERAELMSKAEDALEQNNAQLANDYMDKVEKLDAKQDEAIEAVVNEAIEEMTDIVEKVDPVLEMVNEMALEEPKTIDLKNESVATTYLKGAEVMNEFTNIRDIIASPDYRDAYYMNLINRATPEQMQMLTTASSSAGAAVPQPTLNKIQECLKKVPGIIARAEILDIPGMVKIPYEKTFNDAALHTEEASISGSADVLDYLAMPTYELTKLLPLSANLEATSVDALENWVVNSVVRGVMNKVDYYAVLGSGSSQPAGLASLTYTSGTNGIIWGSTALAYADLAATAALLPAIYQPTACWIMNSKTYWGAVRGLVVGSSYDQIVEGQKVLGFDVVIDDNVGDDTLFLGSIEEGLKVNMPGGVAVNSQPNLRYNTVDFLGAANVAINVIPNAFIKCKKTSL